MNIKTASRESGDIGRSARAGASALPPNPSYVERHMHSWASSRVIARGRDYFRQGRVSRLDSDEEDGLRAQVAGSAEQPYHVEIRFGHSGAPSSRCGCPYDWEPLCKHAVATLLAWQQSETGSEPRLGAAASAPVADGASERESTLRELAAIDQILWDDAIIWTIGHTHGGWWRKPDVDFSLFKSTISVPAMQMMGWKE